MTQRVGKMFGFSVPFLDLLGVRVEHWEQGRSVVSLQLRDELTNSWQFAHGGVVMTLLDVALATAALSKDPESPGLVTINLSVSFIDAGSGALRAEGRVIRGGLSLVFCEGDVRSAHGNVVAKGVGTFKLKRRKDGAEPSPS